VVREATTTLAATDSLGDFVATSARIAKDVWDILDMDDVEDISDDACGAQIAAAVIVTHNQVKHFAHGDTDPSHHLTWRDAGGDTRNTGETGEMGETDNAGARRGRLGGGAAAHNAERPAFSHDLLEAKKHKIEVGQLRATAKAEHATAVGLQTRVAVEQNKFILANSEAKKLLAKVEAGQSAVDKLTQRNKALEYANKVLEEATAVNLLTEPDEEDTAAAAAAAARPKPAKADAIKFLRDVKERFAGEEAKTHVYGGVVELLKKAGSGALAPHEVIVKVRELLHSHEDLIEGFNMFVPAHEAPRRLRRSQKATPPPTPTPPPAVEVIQPSPETIALIETQTTARTRVRGHAVDELPPSHPNWQAPRYLSHEDPNNYQHDDSTAPTTTRRMMRGTGGTRLRSSIVAADLSTPESASPVLVETGIQAQAEEPVDDASNAVLFPGEGENDEANAGVVDFMDPDASITSDDDDANGDNDVMEDAAEEFDAAENSAENDVLQYNQDMPPPSSFIETRAGVRGGTRGGTRGGGMRGGGTRGGAGWEETPSSVSWGGMRVFKARAGVKGGMQGETRSEDGGWRARAHDARAGVWREGGGALRNQVARATAHIGSYTANAASMFQHHVRGVSDLSYAEHLAMTDSTSVPTSLLETSSGRDGLLREGGASQTEGGYYPTDIDALHDESRDGRDGMGSVEYVLGCARVCARGCAMGCARGCARVCVRGARRG
jgi:hypothetical protein